VDRLDRPGIRDALTAGMLIPPISRFMTSEPYTVDRLATLATAQAIMREHGIRHLPVVDGKDVCGIVTARDIQLLLGPNACDPETTLVHAAMTDKPFVATGDMPLDEIVDIMAEHKYGCVIVLGRNGVEGIFTAIDACQALATILRRAAA
jgi:acetoin utilization protein AcuB